MPSPGLVPLSPASHGGRHPLPPPPHPGIVQNGGSPLQIRSPPPPGPAHPYSPLRNQSIPAPRLQEALNISLLLNCKVHQVVVIMCLFLSSYLCNNHNMGYLSLYGPPGFGYGGPVLMHFETPSVWQGQKH